MTQPSGICTECVRDEYLALNIALHSDPSTPCVLCGEKGNAADLNRHPEIKKFCAFLVTWHYAAPAWDESLGGKPIATLLLGENPILKPARFLPATAPAKIPALEQTLTQIFSPKEQPAEKALHLHPSLLTSLKELKSDAWYKYKRELKKVNFFLLENEAREHFSRLTDKLDYELPAGEVYYRARIGYTPLKETVNGLTLRLKLPFEGEALGAPVPFEARPGRANRQGVSFLYLASDKETAIAEVRPHPGHFVSIGTFETSRKLRVANLRFVNLMEFFDDAEMLSEFRFLKDLSEELSIPVLPDEQQNYLVTQFIADILRQLGYEGILYRSSVSKGHNLVVFDAASMQYKPESSELICISAVSFEYRHVEYYLDGGQAQDEEYNRDFE